MNKTLQDILSLLLLASAGVGVVHGQEDDESGRVQYTLILPDEKSPENVKPEENNPFESIVVERVGKEANTEETLVKDLLLRMPVGGAASGLHGMRAMLGGMRLEPGMEVPPVIPDQQVSLRVKSITPTAIELVWVEKKPSGLPPKLLIIPMDSTPSIRYRMPASGTGPQGGNMGTLRKSEVSVFSRDSDGSPQAQVQDSPAPSVVQSAPAPAPAPAAAPEAPAAPEPDTPPPQAVAQPEIRKPAPKTDAADAPPASTGQPAASVLKMLFGKRPPESR